MLSLEGGIMTKLTHRLFNDVLFKLLFVRHPELLKRLVAAILGIRVDDIKQFEITNVEIPPEALGEKFCRLDINVLCNGIKINLEVQDKKEWGYPERILYLWGRLYSGSLFTGDSYKILPRVIVISIVDSQMFGCKEYRSEFRPLEANRHELLSDRLVML